LNAKIDAKIEGKDHGFKDWKVKGVFDEKIE